MLYILNTVLPTKRNFKNAITALYGIGRIRAQKLASILGLHPDTKIDTVQQRQLNKLGHLIERAFLIDFELKRKISLTIRSLQRLKTVRGFSHVFGPPTRGQRTHTNASTARRLSKTHSQSDTQDKRSSSSRFNTKRAFNKNNKRKK